MRAASTPLATCQAAGAALEKAGRISQQAVGQSGADPTSMDEMLNDDRRVASLRFRRRNWCCASSPRAPAASLVANSERPRERPRSRRRRSGELLRDRLRPAARGGRRALPDDRRQGGAQGRRRYLAQRLLRRCRRATARRCCPTSCPSSPPRRPRRRRTPSTSRPARSASTRRRAGGSSPWWPKSRSPPWRSKGQEGEALSPPRRP